MPAVIGDSVAGNNIDFVKCLGISRFKAFFRVRVVRYTLKP